MTEIKAKISHGKLRSVSQAACHKDLKLACSKKKKINSNKEKGIIRHINSARNIFFWRNNVNEIPQLFFDTADFQTRPPRGVAALAQVQLLLSDLALQRYHLITV